MPPPPFKLAGEAGAVLPRYHLLALLPLLQHLGFYPRVMEQLNWNNRPTQARTPSLQPQNPETELAGIPYQCPDWFGAVVRVESLSCLLSSRRLAACQQTGAAADLRLHRPAADPGGDPYCRGIATAAWHDLSMLMDKIHPTSAILRTGVRVESRTAPEARLPSDTPRCCWSGAFHSASCYRHDGSC